jgi:hypothetical protein
MPNERGLHVLSALRKADDLSLIAELVVRQWKTDAEKEQGGREKINRVRRNVTAMFGMPRSGEGSPAVAQRPRQPNAAMAPKKIRIPRPGLAKKIEDAWATMEGRRLLLSLSMRDLAKHFGVSHSSFYEVPLFVNTILPRRQAARRGQQSADWMEKNARSRF